MTKLLGAVVFLAAAAALPAAPPPAAQEPELQLPPLPAAAELTPLNEQERHAGAVILEDVTEVAGHVALSGQDPWVRKSRRVRYLVLDAKGAERLARHSYLGAETEGVFEIRGRTVTAQGEVFPLEASRDVRDLDVKGPRGKAAATVRTVFFPHVEPGAVLDLAWTVTSKNFPAFLLVPLQEDYPIRKLRVQSTGLLLKSNLGAALLTNAARGSFFWVPFFLGRVPPRAHARLDAELNLDLEVEDLAPAVHEPYAPPSLRTEYMLGLLPRPLGLTEKQSARDWHDNLFLFGPPGAVPDTVQKEVIDRELDPAQATVRLDGLALQVPPEPVQEALMEDEQRLLKALNDRFDRFYRRSGQGEDARAVAQIAPPDLAWQERARRLYDHARRRLRPDPGAYAGKRLDEILKQGRAASEDLALYYRLLLERAGIPAHLVLALNRRMAPFQPFLPLLVYGARFLVEAGPPGEEPRYLYFGDLYAGFSTLPDGFLGSLAFRQPDKVEGAWTLFQIPSSLSVLEITRLNFSSRLDSDGKPTNLALETSLEGNAAWAFRFRLGWLSAARFGVAEQKTRRQDVVRHWVAEWANLPFPGEPPVLDPEAQVAGPFSFTVTVPWEPALQKVGSQLLIPALPRADLFQNVFVEEARETPLWLPGGQFEVTMSWTLPAGAEPAALPAPTHGEGPGGLSYSLAIASQPASEKDPARVTSRLVLRLPRFLSNADYPVVRRFFEDLQRSSETRLLVKMGG